MIALTHSELSECLEGHRKGFTILREGEKPTSIEIEADKEMIIGEYKSKDLIGYKDIKDCYELELADAIIRILDICGGLNIPIEKLILAKLEYNKNRPYKHGKQY